MVATLEPSKEFWNEFGLGAFQKQLDQYAGDMTVRQDEAELGRKKLIEMSKEFKKSATDEVRKTVSPLVKAFQSEIDSLTRRSKAAESCFLTVYKKLSDAPDPAPLLNQAVASKQKLSTLTDLELEKNQLRETLEQYNLQFASYKSQEIELDSLKKKLEDCQFNISKEVEAQVVELKDNLTKDYTMKENIFLETNQELSSKLSEQNSTILNLQKSLENAESEIFEFKSKYDEEIKNKNSEIELYLSDLEVANHRLNQSGQLIEQYEKTTSQISVESEISDIKVKQRLLEADLKNKDSEILRLVEETHNLQTEIALKDTEFRSKSLQQDQELETANDKFEDALKELEACSDYHDIKKELTILKSVEFSQTFDNNPEKSLEFLLLEKNRAMQADNSNLRLEVHNYRNQIAALESEVQYSKNEQEEQVVLIKQLEQDLNQLQAHRVREDADGEPSQVVESVTNTLTEESVDMLAIVTSQRERFKAKNQMLETDFQQLKSSYAVLQQDNSTLRTDNMKLYERIKFLQTMSTSNLNLDDDITSKYSSQYEAHIDPFSDFNRKERQRKYVNLNSAERVVLNLGKMILSDKIARQVVFFYSIVLHLLVFLVLYKFAVSEDCIQLSDCNDAYQAHMIEHHP